MNQTSAAAETYVTKSVIHTEFERSLVLHPRLRFETRKLPSPYLMNRGCKIQAWNLWSKSTASDASSVWKKPTVQVQKFIMLASRESRVRVFSMAQTPKRWVHQLDFRRRSRRWISLRDIKTETQLGWKFYSKTRKSYLQKHPLRIELSASRHGRKRCSRRRFSILKSLDSDNLLERLNRSMIALGHRHPWRQVPNTSP